MGASCCINTSKTVTTPVTTKNPKNQVVVPLLARKPYQTPPQSSSLQNNAFEQTKNTVNNNNAQLDPIYGPKPEQYPEPTVVVNFQPPQEEPEHFTNRYFTKRTSEPSLMRLTNEISNLISTFEKQHGTLGNQNTRSNTFNRPQEARQLLVKQSLAENKENLPKPFKITQNGPAPENVEEQQQLPHSSLRRKPQHSSKNNLQSNKDSAASGNSEAGIKKIESRNVQDEPERDILYTGSDRRQSYDSSSQIEASRDLLNSSKVILDDELVDEEVGRRKLQLFNKNNVVEGNRLELWDCIDTERVILESGGGLASSFAPGDQVFFSAFTSICIFYKMFDIVLPAYRKTLVCDEYEVKLWINGTKRGILTTCAEDTPAQILKSALKKLYGSSKMMTNPSNEVYHLGGWCPECLNLAEITNKDNLWDRLTENFLEGNILISFGLKGESEHKQFLNVKEILKDHRKVVVISPKESSCVELEWADLCDRVDKIYINWNPSIYSFCNKFESSWSPKASKSNPFAQKKDVCIATNPQFLIRIPPHEQDFEIRIFVERHIRRFMTGQKATLRLFEYEGTRVMNPKLAIRHLDSSQGELLSDVFIFEKSEDMDYFILAVHNEEPSNLPQPQEVCFSVLFLSFIEVEITELPQREVLLSQSISTNISPKEVGMGINSPNFLDNLQFAIKVPPQSDLQLFVQAPPEAEFSVMLIQDVQGARDVSRVSFEAVLNDNCNSETFTEFGYIEKETKTECHIMVISCYKLPRSGTLKVTANIVSKLFKRDRQLEECFSGVRLQQIYFQPRILKKFPVKWSKDNPGQRKRLKNTTTPIYHPVSIFQEFLKNPTVTLRLERGKYQFNLVCEDYVQQYAQAVLDQNTDERAVEPPALSIALFKLSQNEKGYKIILDDVFYVPIGYGFWTEEVLLEEGKYTVVCSRIQQQQSKGTLRVRQL